MVDEDGRVWSAIKTALAAAGTAFDQGPARDWNELAYGVGRGIGGLGVGAIAPATNERLQKQYDIAQRTARVDRGLKIRGLFTSQKCRKGLSYSKKRRAAHPFAELEADMTLCVAAKAYDEDNDQSVLVIAADWRAEVPWAGGDVVWKLSWGGWDMPAMVAGEPSKAEDFLATCRSIMVADSEAITLENIFDKFNNVSNAHKEKLSRRYVRQRLGITFDRFITRGEKELPSDVRARIFNDLVEIEFGCDVAVAGFIGGEPYIVEVDNFGEVFVRQNFAAIGTGAVIAKSTMYQREQKRFTPVNDTLYNLYEAAKLAHATAPGVGEISEYLIIRPPAEPGGDVHVSQANEKCLDKLEGVFRRVGPKPVTSVPALDTSCFRDVSKAVEEGLQRKALAASLRAESETPPESTASPKNRPNQPSKRRKSKGRQ